MQRNKKKIWPMAMLISTEMLASLLIFSGAFVGLVFLIRPAMKAQKTGPGHHGPDRSAG